MDKKIQRFVLTILLLMPVSAHAARESLAEINLSAGGGFFSNRISSKNAIINRVEFSLWFTHRLYLELSYEKSFAEIGSSSSPDVSIYSASAGYVFGSFKRFLPYINLGFGRGDFVTDRVSDSFSVAEVGTGMKYLFSKDLGLRFDVTDHITTNKGYHNFVVALGLTYLFGTRPSEKVPEPKIVSKQPAEIEVSQVTVADEGYSEVTMYEAEELGLPVREPEEEDIVPAKYWRQRLKTKRQTIAEEKAIAEVPVEKTGQEKDKEGMAGHVVPEKKEVKEKAEKALPEEKIKPLYGLILSVRQYYFAFNSPLCPWSPVV